MLNLEIASTSNCFNRFAFASTLAIYVYESSNFQLIKVFTHADSNISAIEWEPIRERYLAQATADKRLIIWEIESENIKFNVTLSSVIKNIEWNEYENGMILLLLENGKFIFLSN